MGWKPGVSGNPKGRPPKLGLEQTKLRESLAKELPGILDTLIELAKTGDTTACKLILDRVLPPLRPVDQPTAIQMPADHDGAGKAVLEAMARGTLSLDDAATLASVLASLAKVRETTELEARIQRLEDGNGRATQSA